MLKRLALAITICSGCAVNAQSLQFVSATNMPDPFGTFGGLSAIELSSDGATALTLSDRGHIFDLAISRDTAGDISDVSVTRSKHPAFQRDTEGLAIGIGGTFVSFEGPAQVRKLGGKALPDHPDFENMIPNSALEALAIDDAGTLFALPERSGGARKPFPLYAYKNDEWTITHQIPREGPFLPVGADFGPDGFFYLLERAFTPLGFRTRIRRFDLNKNALDPVELLRTYPARHDNLEGLSVWQDSDNQIRLTMVSDDNFLPVLRNQIVEYVLQ
jgi:hypothetical protein